MSGAACIAFLALSGRAVAEPELALSRVQRGGFLLVGNTLGFDCRSLEAAGPSGDPGLVPEPLTGTALCEEAYESTTTEDGGAEDSAPDLYWSREGGASIAAAGTLAAAAESGAALIIPDGSRVTDARLYWAGYLPRGADDGALAPDQTIGLRVPGMSATEEPKEILADRIWTATRCQNDAAGCADAEPERFHYYYQGTADITAIVQGHGPGAYSVTGVDSLDTILASSEPPVSGWWLVVFHEPIEPDPGEVFDLRLLHGLDMVGFDREVEDPGFTVALPAAQNGGTDNTPGRLGIVGYDGDAWLGGDSVLVNGVALTNRVGSAHNFFDSSRTVNGNPTSDPLDFPRLTGEPRSLAGLDLHVVEVSGANGDPVTPSVQVTSSYERFLVGGLIAAVPTSAPLLRADLAVATPDGTQPVPGGVVRYTLTVTNIGNAPATGVILGDDLPPQLTIVPGSVTFSGGGSGPVPAGQITVDPGRLIVRLGEGTSPTNGGTLAVGAELTVTFDALIDPTLTGCTENPCSIANQAAIAYSPSGSDAAATAYSDSDPTTAPADPTVFLVGVACLAGAECPESLPVCVENACVQCAAPQDCPAELPACVENTCVACAADTECTAPTPACVENVCVGCATNDHCAAPTPVCASAECIACLVDDDCTDEDAPLCLDQACVGCRTDDDCPDEDAPLCDAALHLCGCPDGETCASDEPDADGDGLSDDDEATLGSDPEDADTDDDGVPDGAEEEPDQDPDGDGLGSVFDIDSDDDGLLDGTELGYDCQGPGTDASRGHCLPDADGGATTTSSVLGDTDEGGLSDGSEDWNLDGVIDDGETDPNDPSDDTTLIDSDGDGLSDALEEYLGSDPNDADTDDDGVLDGAEPNPTNDLDGDGLIAILDTDMDGDLLLDGVELGTLCDDPDTNENVCLIDADFGATVTSPLFADTDGDGIADGFGDLDLNGVIDENDELFVDGDIRGGGCGCSVPGRGPAPASWLLAGLAALSLAVRRRRR